MSSRYRTFKVWRPENGGEADARSLLATGAEDAAERFASRECSDDPGRYSVYTDGVQVMVRGPTGNLDQIRVYAEQTVVFHTSGGRDE